MTTRERRAQQMGISISDLPDGRGKHGNQVKGKQHFRWNQGKIVSQSGYVRLRVGVTHPLADSNGYANEHLIIWLSAGRCLYDGDVLHHINGDKTDNRIENLQRMTKKEHNQLHMPERDSKTGRFMEGISKEAQ